MSNTRFNTEKVRVFFNKIHWKNILAFSFFVILASIFWVMQAYREKFETSIAIPIKYVNVPDNIVFNNELPTKAVVRIKDDGSTLFRYNLRNQKDSLEIDIKKKLAKYGTQTLNGQVIEDLIRRKLFSTTDLIAFAPSYIDLSHEALHRKKVPVAFNGHIDIASGYIADGEMMIIPDSVYAYGGESALDTINFAHTVIDSICELKSDEKISITLASRLGVTFKPEIIDIDIPVSEFTLKEIEVPVECINLPKNLIIKFFPSGVKIPFYVSLKRYDSITGNDFKVVVDFHKLKNENRMLSSTPINIVKWPDYIKILQPMPAEVEFVLEQK